MNDQKITNIDAKGKKLGRIATHIANILNGKDEPNYMPNKVENIKLEVINASQMDITEKKKKEKIYQRYTGYFGGRKTKTLEQLITSNGYGEALRKAVYGMIPDNKLRNEKMKKLNIKE